jgi:hypothetical protein
MIDLTPAWIALGMAAAAGAVVSFGGWLVLRWGEAPQRRKK